MTGQVETNLIHIESLSDIHFITVVHYIFFDMEHSKNTSLYYAKLNDFSLKVSGKHPDFPGVSELKIIF